MFRLVFVLVHLVMLRFPERILGMMSFLNFIKILLNATFLTTPRSFFRELRFQFRCSFSLKLDSLLTRTKTKIIASSLTICFFEAFLFMGIFWNINYWTSKTYRVVIMKSLYSLIKNKKQTPVINIFKCYKLLYYFFIPFVISVFVSARDWRNISKKKKNIK